MSRLAELIEELCPDGVEYKPLSECVVIPSIPRGLKRGQYESSGTYPIVDQGRGQIAGYSSDETRLVKDIPGIVFGDHTREIKYVDHFFVPGADGVKWIRAVDDVDIRYLFHSLSALVIPSRGYNRHWNVVREMSIPVPPLEVQREIVRILDQFTTLEAELEAELTIRRRQHGFYRSELLARESLQKRVGVLEYKTLGDLFETRNGYTPSKRDRTAWDRDDVPWFRMEDIRENGGILDSALISISNSAVKAGRVFPANSILVATSATIGAHALVTVEHLSNQRFTSLQPKESACGLFDPYFLYYYCFLLDEYCLNHANVSSFASVDMRAFRAFEFPILPLDVQREIASILDQFTGLEKELEAEIEARRAQCTYYRDRLLCFPEKRVSDRDAS